MPKHRGYMIETVTEQSLDSALEPVKIKTFRVRHGEKIIAVGLPTMEAAEAAIDRRHKGRTRIGLEPVG